MILLLFHLSALLMLQWPPPSSPVLPWRVFTNSTIAPSAASSDPPPLQIMLCSTDVRSLSVLFNTAWQHFASNRPLLGRSAELSNGTGKCRTANIQYKLFNTTREREREHWKVSWLLESLCISQFKSCWDISNTKQHRVVVFYSLFCLNFFFVVDLWRVEWHLCC